MLHLLSLLGRLEAPAAFHQPAGAQGVRQGRSDQRWGLLQAAGKFRSGGRQHLTMQGREQ
ncbi:hypothetical protein GCM10008955_09660 [Deinococcus malanensis]|uniref:Uncharacterized protein n=1 Tax=Deinococcus malanensis TaxID=1706855 RepID=A0ABQ2ENL2_9DEIO|nr:hypothetical protein GCM10008955_09660 [Deinococcus malanensis]